MDSLVPVLTDSSVRTCCGLFSAGTEGLVSEVGLDVDSSVPVLSDPVDTAATDRYHIIITHYDRVSIMTDFNNNNNGDFYSAISQLQG